MSDRNWVLPTNERRMSVGVTAANWQHIEHSLLPLNSTQEWLHLDVMDGQFCPKITFGSWLVAALPTEYVLDVHIMTKQPMKQAKAFISAGVHAITIQYEALENALEAMLELEDVTVSYQDQECPLIRGISLCPTTDLAVLEELLPHVEMVQLLTLDPRDGSKMAPSLFAMRLQLLINTIAQLEDKPLLSIDGSMTLDIATDSVNRGANVIVSGSALFKHDQLVDNLVTWRGKLFDE